VTDPVSGNEDASLDEAGAVAHFGHDENLTIQQVSQLLDVPVPTIRSWERRYGVPLADRSKGGHRRYARAQFDQVRRMRDLVAGGRRAADAAALLKASHPTLPGPLINAFLLAARELSSDGIARALDAARETLGLDRAVDEVLLPAMREVGERWHLGRIDVSHEHLATTASQSWLARTQPTGPLRQQPPIILSCGPLDHHTLGLEAMGTLLRQRHWDCRMLGARTPTESLASAVAETDAAAVVLVCHLTAGRAAAIEALRSPQLRHRQIFYAGGAFVSPRARRQVPGHYLGTNLAEAAALITATLTSASR
jgi:methanogenic corrinoid protein MtbC1